MRIFNLGEIVLEFLKMLPEPPFCSCVDLDYVTLFPCEFCKLL